MSRVLVLCPSVASTRNGSALSKHAADEGIRIPIHSLFLEDFPVALRCPVLDLADTKGLTIIDKLAQQHGWVTQEMEDLAGHPMLVILPGDAALDPSQN